MEEELLKLVSDTFAFTDLKSYQREALSKLLRGLDVIVNARRPDQVKAWFSSNLLLCHRSLLSRSVKKAKHWAFLQWIHRQTILLKRTSSEVENFQLYLEVLQTFLDSKNRKLCFSPIYKQNVVTIVIDESDNLDTVHDHISDFLSYHSSHFQTAFKSSNTGILWFNTWVIVK